MEYSRGTTRHSHPTFCLTLQPLESALRGVPVLVAFLRHLGFTLVREELHHKINDTRDRVDGG